MIRFTPQATMQPVAPRAAAKPVAASGNVSATSPETSADLLLPDLDASTAAATAKSSKPRAARKQKTAAESAVQLDLNA